MGDIINSEYNSFVFKDINKGNFVADRVPTKKDITGSEYVTDADGNIIHFVKKSISKSINKGKQLVILQLTDGTSLKGYMKNNIFYPETTTSTLIGSTKSTEAEASGAKDTTDVYPDKGGIKAEKTKKTALYVGIGVVAALIIGVVIYKQVTKK